MRLFLLSLFTAIACNVGAQDYIAYHHIFNRIDQDIENNNTSTALLRLDSVYNQYDFIYANHCIKALQVCGKANDSTRAVLWLAKAFTRGVPTWLLHGNELTAHSLKYMNTQPVLLAYDSLRKLYKASINKDVAERIDKLLEEDQRRTRRVNDGFIPLRYTIYGLQWVRNNKKQFREINRITDTFGFPGEQLIGLSPWYDDSTIASKHTKFRKQMLFDERAYVMLVHYYSYRDADMDEKLLQGVTTGKMPPWQYGMLQDYRAKYGSKKKKHQAYGVWTHQTFDTDPKTDPNINQRRAVMGLNTLEEQHKTDSTEFALRKSRNRQAYIIPE